MNNKNETYLSNLYDVIAMFEIENEKEPVNLSYDKDGKQTSEEDKVLTTKRLILNFDINGFLADKKEDIVKSEKANLTRYRQAESNEDFQLIFEREYIKAKATDWEIFRNYHLEFIVNILSIFKESEPKSYNYKYIEILEKYIHFLRDKQKGKTKPESNFSDYLKHSDPGKLIAELKKLFPNAKGKNAAIMIFALIENDLIGKTTNNIDLIRAIKKEWNIDFSNESFNRPFRQFESTKKYLHKGEIIAAINKVKQIVVI